MANDPNDPKAPSHRDDRGEVRHADPDRAATDPRAAAQQEQVKADHDALVESSRRVDASMSSTARGGQGVETDARAAAIQDQVKADHDALEESARRVDASVPAEVRDTPIQQADSVQRATEATTDTARKLDTVHENAEAARESARRVEESVTDRDRDRDRR